MKNLKKVLSIALTIAMLAMIMPVMSGVAAGANFSYMLRQGDDLERVELVLVNESAGDIVLNGASCEVYFATGNGTGYTFTKNPDLTYVNRSVREGSATQVIISTDGMSYGDKTELGSGDELLLGTFKFTGVPGTSIGVRYIVSEDYCKVLYDDAAGDYVSENGTQIDYIAEDPDVDDLPYYALKNGTADDDTYEYAVITLLNATIKVVVDLSGLPVRDTNNPYLSMMNISITNQANTDYKFDRQPTFDDGGNITGYTTEPILKLFNMKFDYNEDDLDVIEENKTYEVTGPAYPAIFNGTVTLDTNSTFEKLGTVKSYTLEMVVPIDTAENGDKYDVVVEGLGYRTARTTLTVVNEQTTAWTVKSNGTGPFYAGDLNDDGEIDALDLNLMVSGTKFNPTKQYGTVEEDILTLDTADVTLDLTRDMMIEVSDLSYIIHNWGK